MDYISKSLSQGETVLLRAHLHWRCFLEEYFLTLLSIGVTAVFLLQYHALEPIVRYGLMAFAGLMIYWTIHKWIIILSIDMVITNRRVIRKEGVLAITTSEILNSKIESIAIEKTILGHIFGYANIHFSGTGTAHVTFYFVRNAQKIKSELEYIISQNN